MRTWTLIFLLGILSLLCCNTLPSLITVIPAVLAGVFFARLRTRFKLLATFFFGYAWVLAYTYHINAWILPHELEGKSIWLQGSIASIPEKVDHGTNFVVAVNHLQSKSIHARIKLTSQEDNLRAGDEWRWLVHLKQVHGLMNPGGFDYEAIAWQNGIRASGYVVKSSQGVFVAHHPYQYFLTRIRQALKEKIAATLPLSNTSPWITALALGERENIQPENWQVLRNTGTNHLMAIAGLHIGFLSSFIYFMVSWCWKRKEKWLLKLPAQHAGAIAAFCMTLIYSALAGFSLPTQRACWMISTALLMIILRRRILSWQAFCIALLAVLVWNPLSVLSDSFWLSFGSVAIIIYGVSGRLSAGSVLWKIGRLQWVVSLGLIPLGIWLFHECSWVALLANAIAIPCVGFLIVPLTLLGCFFLLFSAKLGGFLLLCADRVLSLLWIILAYLAHLPWATWYQTIPVVWILCAACVGILLLLLPKGLPGKGFGLIALAPLFFYQVPQPKTGEVFFTLLDVGQGLASVVQTAHHVLIFDTGAKFSANYDMGDSVVVPFLRAKNMQKVDMLVISHGDNDHMGGARAILQAFPVQEIKTSVPEKLSPYSANHCLAGQRWQWDGVQFEFMYPFLSTLELGNDSSCVLKITNGFQQRILLTGDIEKFAEKNLVESDKANLAATILVAPHHGSKTSDLDAFIDAVHPEIVLFAVGYRNRFHFPHPRVVEKYRVRHVDFFATDESGAILFDLVGEGTTPYLYRIKHRHFWNA